MCVFFYIVNYNENKFIEFGRAQIYGRLEAKSTFWSRNVWDDGRDGGGGKVSLWRIIVVAEKDPYRF